MRLPTDASSQGAPHASQRKPAMRFIGMVSGVLVTSLAVVAGFLWCDESTDGDSGEIVHAGKVARSSSERTDEMKEAMPPLVDEVVSANGDQQRPRLIPALEQPFLQEAPDLSLLRETVRRNAEGEVIKVYEADAPKAIELRIGDECGFETTDGTNVSCEPGSVCMQGEDSETAFCVAAPGARQSDG